MDKLDEMFEQVLEEIEDEDKRDRFKFEYNIAKVESQLIGLESQLNGVTSKLIDMEYELKIANGKLDKIRELKGKK